MTEEGKAEPFNIDRIYKCESDGADWLLCHIGTPSSSFDGMPDLQDPHKIRLIGAGEFDVSIDWKKGARSAEHWPMPRTFSAAFNSDLSDIVDALVGCYAPLNNAGVTGSLGAAKPATGKDLVPVTAPVRMAVRVAGGGGCGGSYAAPVTAKDHPFGEVTDLMRGSSEPATDWKAEASEWKAEAGNLFQQLQEANLRIADLLIRQKTMSSLCILTARCADLRAKAEAANIFDGDRPKYAFAAKQIEKLIEELKAL